MALTSRVAALIERHRNRHPLPATDPWWSTPEEIATEIIGVLESEHRLVESADFELALALMGRAVRALRAPNDDEYRLSVADRLDAFLTGR